MKKLKSKKCIIVVIAFCVALLGGMVAVKYSSKAADVMEGFESIVSGEEEEDYSTEDSANALAKRTFKGHKLINGVGQYGKGTRNYYIDGTASKYKGLATTAMSEWVNTTKRLKYTTPLSFQSTTNRKSSILDILGTSSNSTGSKGVLAWTEFHVKGGSSVSPSSKNWNYCYVKLYTPNFSRMKNDTCRKGTLAHEMGHCFGLSHRNSERKSIMCQTGSGRAVQDPQVTDLKVINYLYK